MKKSTQAPIKYIPTAESIEAAGIALNKFMVLNHPEMNDGEWQAHCFIAGFHRGIEWSQHSSNLLETLEEVLAITHKTQDFWNSDDRKILSDADNLVNAKGE